jgi:hypothetical protein
MKYLLMLFISIPAFAAEKGEWFCEQSGVRRDDNIYYICGSATVPDEAGASYWALHHALEEFDLICNASTDCAGKPRTVEPQRMTCKRWSNGHSNCHRLLKIIVGK